VNEAKHAWLSDHPEQEDQWLQVTSTFLLCASGRGIYLNIYKMLTNKGNRGKTKRQLILKKGKD
jgi:hypothetical protein